MKNKRICGSQRWHEARGAFIRTGITYIVLTLFFAALSFLHDVIHELLWSQIFSELASLLELQGAVVDEASVWLELERLFSRLERWIRLHTIEVGFK